MLGRQCMLTMQCAWCQRPPEWIGGNERFESSADRRAFCHPTISELHRPSVLPGPMRCCRTLGAVSAQIAT